LIGLKGFGDPFGDEGPPPPSRPAIAEAISEVREQIERASIASGRDPSSVRLVAITKTRTVDEIRQALAAGAEDLGENYIQEARDKARKVPGARWHMVGHLQKNKVNLAVDLFEVIHSLDNASLIKRLDMRCAERRRNLMGLIQVSLGGEKTKRGLSPDQVLTMLDELAQEPPEYLRLSGLMTIPPPVDDPEENRPHFRTLRQTLDRILERQYPFWHGAELSMGMSDDYLVAIQEGATMIRLGRSLFGDRPPKEETS
jgi:pyridoxal phosphate enzyme (YggS family)